MKVASLKVIHARNPSFLGTQYTKIKSARKICTRTELTPLFRGLIIRKKYGKGRGRPVIGFSFSWKAERKDAEDVHVSKQERLQNQIFNIEHNNELSDSERWRALDKVKELPLGTTENEVTQQRQEAERIKIRQEERQKLLNSLHNQI